MTAPYEKNGPVVRSAAELWPSCRNDAAALRRGSCSVQRRFVGVFPCVILFLCFSVLLVLRLPRLGKRELILVLFVRLFGLCLFRFVGFLFLLGSGKGCGLWLWHSLDFSLTFFFTMQMKSAIRLPQTYCKIAANIWLYYGKRDFTKLKICMCRPSWILMF